MTDPTQNRQDILLFKLRGRQLFGLNVLKVQEVIPLADLNHLPDNSPSVIGVAQLRGRTLPVIDLSSAVGGRPVDQEQNPAIIVTEFNRVMQGFLVQAVDRIVPISWDQIQPPPRAAGRSHYVTGVTRIEDEIVEVIDVEKVLSEVSPPSDPSDGIAPVLAQQHLEQLQGKHVLVVDDSLIARKQVANTLEALGIDYFMAPDGKQALDLLNTKHDEGQHIDMIISDIEMPEMDGYTLTRKVREDAKYQATYILLHTSLAGSISLNNAEACGANAGLTKFAADDLSTAVVKGLVAVS